VVIDRPDAPIRVMLVEDHDMVAEAIELAFTPIPDIAVVARAKTLAQTMHELGTTGPDVVVLDRRLPDGDAISIIPRIHVMCPQARVLVLTGDATAAVAARVVRAGGLGLVLKSASLSDLVATVRQVARGERSFEPGMLSGMLDHLSGRSTAVGASLTARERQVLSLLARGLTNEDIAGSLHLAHTTVRNHVQRVLSKLGAHSKLEAVAVGRREGLVD
jgi:DNA-binding NarL/FixJ family response regulator